MTGRDLILYILSNNLEDEPVFQNGKFIGFITAAEAAAKMNVGVPTICVWVAQHQLNGIRIGDQIYIPADSVRPNPDTKE
jgi:excisionase family DNA binding protein